MLKAFRSSVRSSSRSSHVGNCQQRSNEADHPVVGIGDVMEEVETEILVESPCGQVGFYLPKIIVELMSPLVFQQRSQPRGKSNVVKMEPLNRVLCQGLLNTSAVILVSQSPDIVDSGDLLDQIPPKNVFSAGKPWCSRGTAREGAGQDSPSAHRREQKRFTDVSVANKRLTNAGASTGARSISSLDSSIN